MNDFKVLQQDGTHIFTFQATAFVLFQPGYKVKNNSGSYIVQIIEVDTVNNCINLYIVNQ